MVKWYRNCASFLAHVPYHCFPFLLRVPVLLRPGTPDNKLQLIYPFASYSMPPLHAKPDYSLRLQGRIRAAMFCCFARGAHKQDTCASASLHQPMHRSLALGLLRLPPLRGILLSLTPRWTRQDGSTGGFAPDRRPARRHVPRGPLRRQGFTRPRGKKGGGTSLGRRVRPERLLRRAWSQASRLPEEGGRETDATPGTSGRAEGRGPSTPLPATTTTTRSKHTTPPRAAVLPGDPEPKPGSPWGPPGRGPPKFTEGPFRGFSATPLLWTSRLSAGSPY